MPFETYVPQRGRKAKKKPVDLTVKILKNGDFSISSAVYESFFQNAANAELAYDARAKKVGIRPRKAKTKASYKLRKVGGRRYISGSQFLENYGIRLRRTRSYDARWNGKAKLVEFQLK